MIAGLLNGILKEATKTHPNNNKLIKTSARLCEDAGIKLTISDSAFKSWCDSCSATKLPLSEDPTEQLYSKTASHIKEKAPFVAALNAFFYKCNIPYGHAVCVAGYDYDPSTKKGMQVQILDPNGLNVWLPLELFVFTMTHCITISSEEIPNKDWYQKPKFPEHKLIETVEFHRLNC